MLWNITETESKISVNGKILKFDCVNSNGKIKKYVNETEKYEAETDKFGYTVSFLLPRWYGQVILSRWLFLVTYLSLNRYLIAYLFLSSLIREFLGNLDYF